MKFLIALAALAATATATAASAQEMTLKASVLQQKLVTENGRQVTRMVPAAKVTPGDTVHTVLSFANAGAKPASDVVVVNPVPSQMEFLSAEGGALVSVDGGKSFGQLPQLKVAIADGKSRPAVASDVTHVRWNLPPVAAGATGEVRFQARLR